MNKKILVILRHEKSLNIVKTWAEENGIDVILVAMDPIELPHEMDRALQQIKDALPLVDAVAAGTKVYNDTKESSRLVEFMDMLKDMGLGSKPVCLTHLDDESTLDESALLAVHPQTSFVYNDNLGRDQMSNFGPLILKALKP